MAQFGRIERVAIDASGNLVPSATITVRKAGATVNGAHPGGAPPYNITVHDVGSIVTGDSIVVDTGTISIGSATVLNATTIQMTGVTVPSISDKARLSVLSPLPSLFKDAQGTASESNPLSTNANGRAGAWVRGGSYDVKTVGAGVGELIADVRVAAENELSGVYVDSGFVARVRDTLRSLNPGAKLYSWRHFGTEKAFIDRDGNFTALKVTATTDGVTVTSGGITVTSGGISVIAGGISVTASGITVLAGGLDITGDSKLRDKLLFGPSGSEDTNLYRSAADILKTDDSMEVTLKLAVLGRITKGGGQESLASAATISVTKNFVRLTSDGGDIGTINIDGASPNANTDTYLLTLLNVSGTPIDLTAAGNIRSSATLQNNEVLTLFWDDTTGKWRKYANVVAS